MGPLLQPPAASSIVATNLSSVKQWDIHKEMVEKENPQADVGSIQGAMAQDGNTEAPLISDIH